jgi:preprotein translocase subunit SecG
MNALEIVGGILLIIASIFIICVIMLQEGKQAGMGALTGEASTDNFIGRNGGRTKDAFYSKLTKITAVVFFVVTLAMNLILHLSK